MESIDYIVTARHYAQAVGVETVLQRIKKMRENIHKKKRVVLPIQENKFAIDPVHGLIETGQWIAKCECGGAEFVDPDESIFYCFSCTNRAYNHMLRRVVFPDAETRTEIERLLLERPVNDMRGHTDLERAGMAQAVIAVEVGGRLLPLTRSWDPHETLADLHEQQDAAIAAWKQKAGK